MPSDTESLRILPHGPCIASIARLRGTNTFVPRAAAIIVLQFCAFSVISDYGVTSDQIYSATNYSDNKNIQIIYKNYHKTSANINKEN